MKYNKYVLFLIILVSSAFASVFKIYTDSDLNKLVDKILSKIPWSPVPFDSFDEELLGKIKFGLNNGILTESQFNCLEKLKTDKNSIFTALKDNYKKELKSYVTFINYELLGLEYPYADLYNFFKTAEKTAEKVDAMKEFQNDKCGRRLVDDEIESFLIGGNLPPLLTPAEKIFEILNDLDSVQISNFSFGSYKNLLTVEQFDSICLFETNSNRTLSKAELSDYLNNIKLLPYTIEEKLDFLLKYAEGDNSNVSVVPEIADFAETKQIDDIIAKEKECGARISRESLKAILTATGDVQLEELTKPLIVVPPTPPGPPAPSVNVDLANEIFKLVKNGKIEAASRNELKVLGVTEAQIGKLIAVEGFVSKKKIKSILKDASQVAKTLSLADTVAGILKLVHDKKIAMDKQAELKKLNLSEDQIKKLLAAVDLDSAAKIEELLNPAKPKSRTLAENVAEILKLVHDKKIAMDKQAELKKLNLSEDQIKALLAATDLDTSAKIEELLNSTPIKDKELSSDKSVSQKSNGVWYTSTWFLIVSGILLASAIGIGGGSYIMTRKKDL